MELKSLIMLNLIIRLIRLKVHFGVLRQNYPGNENFLKGQEVEEVIHIDCATNLIAMDPPTPPNNQPNSTGLI